MPIEQSAPYYTLHELPDFMTIRSYATELGQFMAAGLLLHSDEFFKRKGTRINLNAAEVKDLNPFVGEFLSLHQKDANKVTVGWSIRPDGGHIQFKTDTINGQQRTLKFIYDGNALANIELDMQCSSANGDEGQRIIQAYVHDHDDLLFPINVSDFRSFRKKSKLLDESLVEHDYSVTYQYGHDKSDGIKLIKAEMTIPGTDGSVTERYDGYANTGDLKLAHALKSFFPPDTKLVSTFYNRT